MRRAFVLVLMFLAVVSVWGCKQATPEEKVAKTRARYEARLNSFFVRDVPVAGQEESEPMADDMEAEAEGGEEPVEGDPSEESMMAPETLQEVTLDIIVQHDAATALPGITLDITLVDAQQNVKGSWRLWVETEGLPKANQKPITHVLTDVGYEEGDGWNVEVRRPIPVEERGDYREFSA